jgi:pimeloyl-ACP methyl ester carboxylesterase
LSDANLNAKTDYSTILYQASAFNEYRVFAPRYRQAHLRSYYSESKDASNAFDTAYEDIKAAFAYYLTNYNNNRPLIIASHSQGTTHALRLLKEFKENTAVSEKLVAAYLVGMYIPSGDSAILPICKDSIDVGCLCAWRSFQSNYLPSYVKNEKEPSLVVNPLTWTTENKYAPKTINRGSVLRNFNRVYSGVADARIEGGVLWINKPQFPGSFLVRMKNYHIADINFFYVNIRENVRHRINQYKQNELK